MAPNNGASRLHPEARQYDMDGARAAIAGPEAEAAIPGATEADFAAELGSGLPDQGRTAAGDLQTALSGSGAAESGDYLQVLRNQGMSAKERLEVMIDYDEERAVQVLRRWLNEAA